jgi:hypothetical protein
VEKAGCCTKSVSLGRGFKSTYTGEFMCSHVIIPSLVCFGLGDGQVRNIELKLSRIPCTMEMVLWSRILKEPPYIYSSTNKTALGNEEIQLNAKAIANPQ